LVARYIGQAFVVLLPHTPRGGAEHVARRILDSVKALGIAHEASSTAPHVTVSIGIACYDHDSKCWVPGSADSRFADQLPVRCSAIELVLAANKALHCAKSAGQAQARLLDIADVDMPQLARDLAPASRKPLAAGVRQTDSLSNKS
jgi:GGDEF domain-containing protein